MDPAEGGPLDDNPFPQLVTRRWVYEQYLAWWRGSEGSSPHSAFANPVWPTLIFRFNPPSGVS